MFKSIAVDGSESHIIMPSTKTNLPINAKQRTMMTLMPLKCLVFFHRKFKFTIVCVLEFILKMCMPESTTIKHEVSYRVCLREHCSSYLIVIMKDATGSLGVDHLYIFSDALDGKEFFWLHLIVNENWKKKKECTTRRDTKWAMKKKDFSTTVNDILFPLLFCKRYSDKNIMNSSVRSILLTPAIILQFNLSMLCESLYKLHLPECFDLVILRLHASELW